MGLAPDEAERIIQACADAGIAFEFAMSVIKEPLNQSPQEFARRAAALREFAVSRDAADRMGRAIGAG